MSGLAAPRAWHVRLSTPGSATPPAVFANAMVLAAPCGSERTRSNSIVSPLRRSSGSASSVVGSILGSHAMAQASESGAGNPSRSDSPRRVSLPGAGASSAPRLSSGNAAGSNSPAANRASRTRARAASSSSIPLAISTPSHVSNSSIPRALSSRHR